MPDCTAESPVCVEATVVEQPCPLIASLLFLRINARRVSREWLEHNPRIDSNPFLHHPRPVNVSIVIVNPEPLSSVLDRHPINEFYQLM
jgi:hypothetical protein